MIHNVIPRPPRSRSVLFDGSNAPEIADVLETTEVPEVQEDADGQFLMLAMSPMMPGMTTRMNVEDWLVIGPTQRRILPGPEYELAFQEIPD